MSRCAGATEFGYVGIGDTDPRESVLQFRGIKSRLLARGVFANIDNLFDTVELQGMDDLVQVATLIPQRKHPNPGR